MEIESEAKNEFTVASTQREKKRSPLGSVLQIFIMAVLVACGSLWFLNTNNNYEAQVVTVEKGANANTIATMMEEQGLVRSETLFYAALGILGDPNVIKAGDYVMPAGLTTFELAERILSETPQEAMATVTLPEGVPVSQMATIVSNVLPNITADEFVAFAKPYEGYLWPETYFIPLSYDTEQVVDLLLEAGAAAYKELQLFERENASDLIILASIVEREANTPESMRMVAGIFANRLAVGMPLQADATIEYVLDTPLGELGSGQLAEELREMDSLYNTYTHNGLPPTPIGNPGKEAIEAVLYPTESEYLYYLTDDEGDFYYAVTYDEHLENIERYLR